MLIFRLAMRNATRNVQRTLLTATTVVFGTALLTVAMAWIDGIFELMLDASSRTVGHVRLVDPDFAEREQLMPLYENVSNIDQVMSDLEGVPGFVKAYPRITTGVTITATEDIGDNFGLVVGAPSEWFIEQLEIEDDIVHGGMFSELGEGVIGSRVAERVGAAVGDEILLLGMTQDGSMSPYEITVTGIANAGNPFVDQAVFMPLEAAQWITDISDGATELLVYGADRHRAVDLRRAIEASGDFTDYTAQAWSEREPMNGLVAVADVIWAVLAGIIIFITSLGVWNTMMMSVLERTGEIGVMRAMGLSRLGTVSLFVVEALAIALIGGLVGVAIGGMGGFALEIYGIELGDQVTQNLDANMPIQSHVYADMSWRVAFLAMGSGMMMALVGSAAPAIRAALIQPVEAMRSRR